MTARFFVTRDPHGTNQPLALLYTQKEDGQVWEYCPQTDAFHTSPELAQDFHFEHALTYDEVNSSEAFNFATANIGSRKGVVYPEWLEKCMADPVRIPAGDILPGTPHPRKKSARDRALEVASAARRYGGAVVYKSLENGSNAHQTAADIRRGRVKALPPAEFDSRVERRSDHWDVLVQVKTDYADACWCLAQDAKDTAARELKEIIDQLAGREELKSASISNTSLLRAALRAAKSHLDDVVVELKSEM